MALVFDQLFHLIKGYSWEICEVVHALERCLLTTKDIKNGAILHSTVHLNLLRLNRQRVNVLGALGHDGELIRTIKEKHTVRDDMIAFYDGIAEQPCSVPRIVLHDNSNIHRGDAMEEKPEQTVAAARLVPSLFTTV